MRRTCARTAVFAACTLVGLLPTATSALAAQEVPTGVARVGAAGLSAPKARVGVVVFDTGVARHPDLDRNVAKGKSCVPSEPDPRQDGFGHGTQVAGIIAARDNRQGVVGVNPRAKIYPVKVFDQDGQSNAEWYDCGLDWVANNARRLRIKIMNASVTGPGQLSDHNCGLDNSDRFHQLLCRIRDAGVTIIVPAGNGAADTRTYNPGNYKDAVISVAALCDYDGMPGGLAGGLDDTFASWSNWGQDVDLAAPGCEIVSTTNQGGYSFSGGTSFASPHVAGLASRYLADHPQATWTEVRDALVAAGEVAGSGHTADPLHPEPVAQVIR